MSRPDFLPPMHTRSSSLSWTLSLSALSLYFGEENKRCRSMAPMNKKMMNQKKSKTGGAAPIEHGISGRHIDTQTHREKYTEKDLLVDGHLFEYKYPSIFCV